jgi:hypothetical protein
VEVLVIGIERKVVAERGVDTVFLLQVVDGFGLGREWEGELVGFNWLVW